MARKPRIHFKGAVYHVLLKGYDGQAVFKTKKDRLEWEALVEEGCMRFGHLIHAYCWLNNQINLTIQVADIPLSRIMQNLSFRYTRYFNRRLGMDGSVFHGRYKAILIDPAEYLNDLTCYIHNLPLSLTRITRAEDYQWSSYSTYLGKTETAWLTTDSVLSTFGRTNRTAISAYRKFVSSSKGHLDRTDLVRGNDGGRLLGGARFLQKAQKPVKTNKKHVSLSRMVRYICQTEGVSESSLKKGSRARRESSIRQMISCVAIDLDIATLTDMAQRFNRDLTTMSRNQRYFREKMIEDPELLRSVNKYKIAISKM